MLRRRLWNWPAVYAAVVGTLAWSLQAAPSWDLANANVKACVEGGVAAVQITLPAGTNEVGAVSSQPGWPVKPRTSYAVTVRLKSPNVPAACIKITELGGKGEVARAERNGCDFHSLPAEWDYVTRGFFTGPETKSVLIEIRGNSCGRNKEQGMALFFAEFQLRELGPVPEPGKTGRNAVLDPGFEKSPIGAFTRNKAAAESSWSQHSGYIGKLEIMADAGQAHAGRHYLHSEVSKPGVPSGMVQDKVFQLAPGSLMRVAFWARGRGEAHASIGLKDSRGGFLYAREVVKQIDSPDGWLEVTGEILIEDCAVRQGEPVFYNFGSLDLDDYSVTVYPPKPQPLPTVD